jgi:transposase
MSVKNFLYDEEVVALKRQHKKCVVKRYADRLKAMLLLKKGFSFAEVAEILVVDDDTIRRWHRVFDDEGIVGLQRDFYKGATSKLDDTKLEALAVHLDENLYLSAKTICNRVKSEWEVEYSESGMTKLLHELGFVFKKPTVTPGMTPSEQVQREFVAKIIDTIENKGLDDQVYFADGVHQRLNTVGFGKERGRKSPPIPDASTSIPTVWSTHRRMRPSYSNRRRSMPNRQWSCAKKSQRSNFWA